MLTFVFFCGIIILILKEDAGFYDLNEEVHHMNWLDSEWLKDHVLEFFLGIPTLVGMICTIGKWFKHSEWSEYEVIITFCLVVVIVIILIRALWCRYSYRSYIYPKSKIETKYEIKNFTVKYTRTKDDILEFSRRYEIISKICDLEYIVDKYIWTGDSEASVPKASGDVKEISNEERVGIWNYFHARLNKTLSKDQHAILQYTWPRIENCSSSSPFVSAPTDIPTKELTFDVDLGEEYKNAKLILEVYRSIDATYPISCRDVTFDEKGRYSWKPKTKRFRYYLMRWTWIDKAACNNSSSATNNKEEL